MIRFQHPAQVSGTFMQAMSYCASETLRTFREYPVSSYDYASKHIERATAIRYLIPLAKLEHKALDELITRLRKLKYEKYEFYQGRGGFSDGYFLGMTQPLTMTSSEGERWEIGRYTVEAPAQGILNRCLDLFKMHPVVPDVEIVHAYHPHHTSTYTCWSEWSQSLTEACTNCHFDRIFATFLGFLQNYYPGSPLARPPGPGETRDPGTDMYWMIPLGHQDMHQISQRR